MSKLCVLVKLNLFPVLALDNEQDSTFGYVILVG